MISKCTCFAAQNVHKGILCKTFQHKSFPIGQQQDNIGIKFCHHTVRQIYEFYATVCMNLSYEYVIWLSKQLWM